MPFDLVNWGSYLLISGLSFFWVISGLFALLDLKFFHYVSKYKFDPNVKINKNEYVTLAKSVFIKQIISFPLFGMFFLHLCRVRGINDIPFDNWNLPICLFLIQLAINDFLIYVFHRTLHIKKIYPLMHRIHHEWTSPVSVESFHSSLVEQFLINWCAGFIGILLLKFNLQMITLWMYFSLTSSLLSHCGYDIPFVPTQSHHSHHKDFTTNFGGTDLWDWCFGTLKKSTKVTKKSRTLERVIFGIGVLSLVAWNVTDIVGNCLS